MPYFVQHTDFEIGFEVAIRAPIDLGAADPAGEDIREKRAGILRESVRGDERDGATGGVLANGLAGGNSSGGGAYYHHVSLEFNGRRAVRAGGGYGGSGVGGIQGLP